MSSALQVCPGASALHGVDVSTYQGTIAWAQVKAAKIDFAFARISDGTTHPDAQFASNWQGMKSAGLVRGAYQYFRASQDAAGQANLVVSSLATAGGLLPGDLPVVLDLETADGQSESTIEAHVQTWLVAVAAQTGRAPIVYTSLGTYPVTTSAFASYPLWVADWTTACPAMPNGWSDWKFWQYSDTGSVPGISGAVDLDEFDGTLADLTSFGGGRGLDGATLDGGNRGDGGGGDPDAGTTGGGAGAGDAGSGQPPDAGAFPLPDAGATMGGGLVDASTTARPCSP
jgi:lysozyme